MPLAYLAMLRRNPAARVLDLLADAPYAVPGTVLAIAIIIVFLPPLPFLGISLYGTLGIILVAYLARFLALALRPTVAGMELVSRNLDEAAQVAGAGVITRLRSVILPAVAPSAAAGALLIFMTAFNELTVSALLWSTGHETLGVAVFFLHYEGNSPAAAAVAAISIAVTLALAVLHERHGAQSAGRSGAVAGVSFEAVSKAFGETRAVEGVSLEIADGEFFALLGPSGCGKTTLLRLVAGFEMPDAGSVKLGDAVVGKPGWALPPEKRRIGMVFQSYALWPHMTVAENVAFALRVRRVAEAERVRIVERVAGQGRPRGRGGAASARALRRPAPARRAGALPRHASGRRAARRAARQSRRASARGDARGVRALPQGDPRDLHLCHPRSGRGAGARRSRRGDGCRHASSRWRRRACSMPSPRARWSRASSDAAWWCRRW